MAIKVPIYDGQGNQTDSAKIFGSSNKANYALATAQNKWNLEQWERQNEYNSPANQIKLLKEAGLNPNLYANSGATAESLVSADMANQQDMSGQYLNAMQMGLQNFNASLDRGLQEKVVNLEKQKVDLESARVENETRKTDSDISLQGITGLKGLSDISLNDEQKKTLQKEREVSEQNIQESRQKVDNMKTENGIRVKDLNAYDKDKLLERALKHSQSANLDENTKYFGRLIDLSYEEQLNLQHQGTSIMMDYLLKGQQFDQNERMNKLLIQSQSLKNALLKFQEQHQSPDWWIDQYYRGVNSFWDGASTIATFGVSRAIRNFSPFGGQQQRRMPFNQSFRNTGNGFEQHMKDLQLINGW